MFFFLTEGVGDLGAFVPVYSSNKTDEDIRFPGGWWAHPHTRHTPSPSGHHGRSRPAGVKYAASQNSSLVES